MFEALRVPEDGNVLASERTGLKLSKILSISIYSSTYFLSIYPDEWAAVGYLYRFCFKDNDNDKVECHVALSLTTLAETTTTTTKG